MNCCPTVVLYLYDYGFPSLSNQFIIVKHDTMSWDRYEYFTWHLLTRFLSSWGSVSDDQHFSRLSLTQVIPIVHDVINLIISINYSQDLKISLLGDNILKCCWLDEKLYQANWRQTNKHCKYFWEDWRTVWSLEWKMNWFRFIFASPRINMVLTRKPGVNPCQYWQYSNTISFMFQPNHAENSERVAAIPKYWGKCRFLFEDVWSWDCFLVIFLLQSFSQSFIVDLRLLSHIWSLPEEQFILVNPHIIKM